MLEIFQNIKYQLANNFAASIIDIILYAVLLYFLFVFLKNNHATRLIKYMAIFLIAASIFSAGSLGFHLLSQVFSYAIVLLLIVVSVLFPQEVRRGLWKIASPKEMQEAFNTVYDCKEDELLDAISDIVRAVQNMAKKDIGALIVIAPEDIPMQILESGTSMDAKISCPLIECLFNTKAPLHDGAVFIRGNRILAAGCFLPLTQNSNLDKELGTRHRAGVGVTENHNVLTIIVSEETGVISVAIDGVLTRYYDSEMLTSKLKQVYGLNAIEGSGKRKKKKRMII